jgi:hypothetical protein
MQYGRLQESASEATANLASRLEATARALLIPSIYSS